jgi:abortive infection alpha-like protein
MRDLLPGLMRITAGVWWRTAGWAAGTSLRIGSRLVRAAMSGESSTELFRNTRSEFRDYARRLLDIRDTASMNGAVDDPAEATAATLRERGAELLRRSADVHSIDDAHPAYERILDEIAPDEVRILRLLALEGPQPAVDVRSGPRALGVISELVAPGLSMIGAEAGCRFADRVPAYLNNLHRLGLVWFSREPVKDLAGYQVLEAQPDVIEAMRSSGRAHTVRRSIHLTPFGEDFCARCLPIHSG